MADEETPKSPRSFSRIDAHRAITRGMMLAVVGLFYWLILPGIQWLVIPSAPGGKDGPWLVRPHMAFRFGAMAVMTVATLSLIARPLEKVWAREDEALGTRYDVFHGRPGQRGLFVVKCFLILAIYTSALVFYLFSWTRIGPDGIEERLPWGTRNHSFQDIASLEMIPDGERSESIKQDGPWYSIRLKSGQSITVSDDNEGSTLDELRAMASYITDRSGFRWVRRSDAQQEKSPASLPPDVVAAWQNEDAEVGWMGIGEFEALTFEDRRKGKIDDVPAFKFDVWKPNVLNALPAPNSEFGLCLGDTKITDAGLKELSHLKSLHSLDLGFTPATDAGLKELAALKSLKALNLRFGKVSDVGLRVVGAIKSLELLNLRGTKITDTGLKEIASLSIAIPGPEPYPGDGCRSRAFARVDFAADAVLIPNEGNGRWPKALIRTQGFAFAVFI